MATYFDMMFTLIAAGYGSGFVGASQIAMCRHPEAVARLLNVSDAVLTTYLLRSENRTSIQLDRFLERVLRVE